MPNVIEAATSGRAACRGCGRKIAKDELRFGERLPNAFGEGEMTLWFHLQCAAYKRPEPFLETLSADTQSHLPNRESLAADAERGLAHRRLPRVDGAERAPTGRAKCRHCREPIEHGAWRISLVFFEEYRFAPSGFVHAGCAGEYLETTDVVERVRHFRPELTASDVEELRGALARAA